MKRKILCGLMIAAGVFVLGGCQSTPNDEAVVQKDSNKMIEKATEKTKSGFQIPTVYKDKFSNKNFRTNVVVDTKVSMPKVNKYPVVAVGKREFNEKEVNEIIDYFSKGKTVYALSDEWNKKEIEDEIVIYKSLLKDYGNATDTTGLTYKEEIKQMQQKLASAPDKDEKVEASRHFITDSKYGGSKIRGTWMEKDGRKANVVVSNGSEGNEVNFQYTCFPKGYSYYSSIDMLAEDAEIIPPSFEKLSITKEEAEKKAQQVKRPY